MGLQHSRGLQPHPLWSTGSDHRADIMKSTSRSSISALSEHATELHALKLAARAVQRSDWGPCQQAARPHEQSAGKVRGPQGNAAARTATRPSWGTLGHCSVRDVTVLWALLLGLQGSKAHAPDYL